MVFNVISIVFGVAAVVLPLVKIAFKKGGSFSLWLSYAFAFCAMIFQFFEILSLVMAGHFASLADTAFLRSICAVLGSFLVLLLQLFAAPRGSGK